MSLMKGGKLQIFAGYAVLQISKCTFFYAPAKIEIHDIANIDFVDSWYYFTVKDFVVEVN